MKNKILLLIFITLLNAQYGLAQNGYGTCGRKIVDCAGLCGAFVDVNGDGFCDYGLLSSKQSVNHDTERVIIKDTNRTINQNHTNYPNHVGNNVAISNKDTVRIQESDTDTTETSGENVTQNNNNNERKSPYHFLLITIITFSLYFISMIFVKLKFYKKYTHRRIWNMMLLITFLMSGVLGLILTIQLTYDVWLGIYRDFLVLHVEFGIAMGFIAIIHAAWHWKYFRNLLSSSANKGKCE